MTSRRGVILDELERWRAEGAITDDFYDTMRTRYESMPDEPLPATGAGAATARDRGGFAVSAMQLVGGILLGAALVALVAFLDLDEAIGPWVMLLFGFIGIIVGVAVHYMAPGKDGLEEAAFAAGLIPLAVATVIGGITTFDYEPQLMGGIAAALSAAVYVVRRGHGPVVVLAGAAYAMATLAIAQITLFGDANPTLWLLLLLAFGALLLVWRDELWTTVGLGLYVIPVTAAFIGVLTEQANVDSSEAIELLVGAFLGVLMGLGVWLGNRGLVAGAAAGLTIDAVIFANELGGPGTAVVVLLVLGGLLVWQAEFLRRYFARGSTL